MGNDKLIVRMSPDELQFLKEKAAAEGLLLSQYVRSKLLPAKVDEADIDELMQKVFSGINDLKPGETFSLPDFFEPRVWSRYSKGLRLHLGRKFKRMIDDNDVVGVRFERYKTNHMAEYRKM